MQLDKIDSWNTGGKDRISCCNMESIDYGRLFEISLLMEGGIDYGRHH